MKQGDYDPVYGNQSTGGSRSIRTTYTKLRQAGAVAREMLIAAAAQKWNVRPKSCKASRGTVIHIATGRTLTYGDLVDAAGRLPVPPEVPLKDPKDFSLLGTDNMKSKNGVSKVNGALAYGLDFTLPGMLTSVVARCPVFGGRVKSYDDTAALVVPGVRHVKQITSGVAVVADNTFSALRGRGALEIIWDEGPHADLTSAEIAKALKKAADSPGEVLRADGNAAKALSDAETAVEAVYELPFLDHATMEPMNCTALVLDGVCKVWGPLQTPASAHEAAKKITGLPDDKVEVHILPIGVGYGRRLKTDFVEDAVEVARQLEVPVKVIRMREEDIQHGFYRPASYHHLRGGLNRKGQPVAWTHRASGPADSSFIVDGDSPGYGIDMPYAIPNVHVDKVTTELPVPTGAFRSVANTQHGFVNESFIDELAHAANKDPYTYRRNLMKDRTPRLLRVLDLAAEQADWGKKQRGRYQGIAAHASFRSYVAMVVEISVSRAGQLKLHRVIAAIDCGIMINPDGVRAQVEGAVIMALTAALYGAITLKAGRVQQSNFHNYRLMTIDETPKIHVHMVPGMEAPTGVGEPGVPPTAPALTNAIFVATGKRIRKLPISLHKLT